MRNLVLLLVTLVATSCSIVKTILRSEDLISVTPNIDNGEFVLTQSHFRQPNAHYVINRNCTLRGSKIFIPSNCTISFIGGSINDGTIVGADTYVKAHNEQIFGEALILKGTFSAKSARPVWFGIKPDCILDSEGRYVSGTNWIEGFALLLLFDKIQLDKGGIYYINGHLSTRSNQSIKGNNATIKWSYLKHKALFEVGYANGYKYVENVKFSNLNIIGNKLETDDVTEQCHGICIGYASNVSICDVRVSYCRGDGIYVGSNVTVPRKDITPKNIDIMNVRCLYNHRQGMSITRVDGLKVKNSEFSYTSGTAPSAGIDIEPNKKTGDNGEVYITDCRNISISNCSFWGNEGYGLVMGHSSCNQENVQEVISNVELNKCNFRDNRLYVYGGHKIRIHNLSMDNSTLEMRAPGYTDDIVFKDLKFTCNIKDNEMSAISFILYSVANANSKINNITFDKIDIIGYGAYGINIPQVQSKGVSIPYISGLTIKRNTIKGCSVPLYIGPAIERQKLTSNRLLPQDANKLTPSQLKIREKAPTGIFIQTDVIE